MPEILSPELVSAAQKGDSRAIEQLVEQFRKPLFHYACNYLNNEFDAEDVTQEALLKAVKALPSFKGDSSLSTWLFRILINTCIDFRRKTANQQVSYFAKAVGDDEETVIEVRDSRPLPDEEVEQMELRSFIKEAIAKLNPEHRTIVVLHDLQGFKYHEIAAITQTSLGTVKSRLFYARQELRKLLKPVMEKR